jgi:hypothetical protein
LDFECDDDEEEEEEEEEEEKEEKEGEYKCILEKWDLKIWPGLKWMRIKPNDRLL